MAHRHAEDERGERPHHGVLPALGHRRAGAQLSVPADHARDAVFVTSLTGYELGRIRVRPSRARQSPSLIARCGCRPARRCGSTRSCVSFALSCAVRRLRYRTRLEISRTPAPASPPRSSISKRGERERIEADYLGRLRRRDKRDPRRSSASGSTGQGVLGHPLHLFFRAPDFLKRVGKAEGTFFLAIDRDGLWANIRVVDPVNAMWRLMVLDSDGKQTPETIDKDALIRRAVGRPFEVEWVGLQHLDATKRGGGTILTRAACFSPAMPCTSCRRPARWA